MVRALSLLLVTACQIGPAIYVERVGEGSGEITSEPEGLHCGDDCAMILGGREVTLVATAREGSRFAGWSDPRCSEARCTLPIYDDTQVTARFDIATYPLRVAIVGRGSAELYVNGSRCDGTCYVRHGRITVDVRPAEDTKFLWWEGEACAGVATTCLLDVRTPLDVTAVIDLGPMLTVDVVGEGRIVSEIQAGIDCGTQCRHAFPENSSLVLHPLPAPGWTLASWDGPCTLWPMGCSLHIAGQQHVTATFVPCEGACP